MAPLRLAGTTYVLTLLCCALLFLDTTAVPANHTNGSAVLDDEAALSRAAECSTSPPKQSCWGQTEVPDGGPWPEIAFLYIYESSIQVLRNNAFQSFPRLLTLTASECNIESIETNVFSGLSYLESVDLRNNKIRSLRSVDFPESVVFLDVSKNPLDFSGPSPFPESHPRLRKLYANDVGLSEITSSHIRGLSALTHLSLGNNSLTSLKLEAFVGLEKLRSIDVDHNSLENIVGLPSGVELRSVGYFYAAYNNIRSLDVHVFEGLPFLQELTLHDNPLKVPSSTPFLSHEYLRSMFLSNINAAALSSRTLEGLPRLQALEMNGAGVSDITGAFSKLPKFRELYLMDNNVQSVKKGTFATGSTLVRLILTQNPLRELDPAALDDVMPNYSTIDISHSPMACAKDYDDLSEWCSKNNVRLNAACKDTTAPPGTNPPGTGPPGTAPPVKPPPVDDDCAADADCGEGFCCKNKECLEKGKCGVSSITSLPFLVILFLAYCTLAQKLPL